MGKGNGKRLAEGQRCLHGGAKYECVKVPWAYVETSDFSAPSKLCLAGEYSWVTCGEVKFLCDIGFLGHVRMCKEMKAMGVNEGGKGDWEKRDWDRRDCVAAASHLLARGAGMRLLDDMSAVVARAAGQEKHSRMVDVVSVASRPKESFDLWAMCASFATRLAFGFNPLWLRLGRFSFSEKPRKLLAYVRGVDSKSVVWFQVLLMCFFVIFLECVSGGEKLTKRV